jgi:Tyrosyl-DNA phosphodiesterase
MLRHLHRSVSTSIGHYRSGVGVRIGFGTRPASGFPIPRALDFRHSTVRTTSLLGFSTATSKNRESSSRVRHVPNTTTMVPAAEDQVIDLTTSSPPASRSQPHTTVFDDEDDEDLRLAIAMSLQQQEQEEDRAQGKGKVPRSPDLPATEQHAPQPSGPVGVVGLDRKAMEAERLARLKRKRDVDVDDDDSVPEMVRAPRISPPPLRRRVAAPNSANAITPIPANVTTLTLPMSKSAVSKPSPASSLSETVRTYPTGIILKTHAPGYPADLTISFTDLIAPVTSLTSCLLSSFIWDFDWLFPHFSTKSTNFLLVMHAKYPGERAQIESDFNGIPNIKVCFPPMGGNVNCMHSKLMLLFYTERCRVVVPTANLMGFDWGRGSVMENMVWLIDLPLLDTVDGPETEFKSSLIAFLRAQTVPQNVIEKLGRYDFSGTQEVRFVHSIGGSHDGEQWRETGHCGLGKAVSSLGLATSEPIEVDFVTSSVGSLNEEFMRSIYVACQGDDGLTEYTLRTAKTVPARRVDGDGRELVQKNAGQSWRSHFRFYFPSQNTVDASNGGPGSAGTICFQQKWWEGTKFPRENMQDCVSVRAGLLMHNKVGWDPSVCNASGSRINARSRLSSSTSPAPTTWTRGDAWAGRTLAVRIFPRALGRLSPSPQHICADVGHRGRLVQDKLTKRPKLNCRNWECGVVVPIQRKKEHGSDSSQEDSSTACALQGLATSVPIPMQWPSEPYEEAKRRPWFFGGG